MCVFQRAWLVMLEGRQEKGHFWSVIEVWVSPPNFNSNLDLLLAFPENIQLTFLPCLLSLFHQLSKQLGPSSIGLKHPLFHPIWNPPTHWNMKGNCVTGITGLTSYHLNAHIYTEQLLEVNPVLTKPTLDPLV